MSSTSERRHKNQFLCHQRVSEGIKINLDSITLFIEAVWFNLT